MEYNIESWVADAAEDRAEFRKAVHTILHAIADNEHLKPKMIMKGGMLLGIRYNSDRFTEDIDFSTSDKYKDLDVENFRTELNDSLLIAYDDLGYGIRCQIQSIAPQPKKGIDQATFPSLKLKIGYANDRDQGALKRLEQGQSANTVKIDYSFNEITHKIDDLVIDDGSLKSYGFEDLVAEKLRSIHQQIERNRNRRQDIYDLHYLLNNVSPPTAEEKLNILIFLFEKSVERLPLGSIHQHSLDNEEIKKRSQNEYHMLSSEISGELPDFDTAYAQVNEFYKSLPWDSYVSK